MKTAGASTQMPAILLIMHSCGLLFAHTGLASSLFHSFWLRSPHYSRPISACAVFIALSFCLCSLLPSLSLSFCLHYLSISLYLFPYHFSSLPHTLLVQLFASLYCGLTFFSQMFYYHSVLLPCFSSLPSSFSFFYSFCLSLSPKGSCKQCVSIALFNFFLSFYLPLHPSVV